MGGLRFSTTSAIIGAASLLAYQAGAHAVSQRNLRHISTDGYTHLGCFKDSKKDRVLGYMLANGNNTPDFCYDYCVGLDTPLMATQFGRECWCATDVDVEYERHGEGGRCNYPCAGNENEMCGGKDAFDLYLIQSTDTTLSDSETTPEETPEEISEEIPEETPEETAEETPEGALHEDIVQIIDVVGDEPGGARWADSYSVGNKCYMQSTFDHEADKTEVDTPRGTMTIGELFDTLAPGPDSEGRPLYNDVQCGNGPQSAQDEVDCPGLVEYGLEGCGQIGPMWDLSELE